MSDESGKGCWQAKFPFVIVNGYSWRTLPWTSASSDVGSPFGKVKIDIFHSYFLTSRWSILDRYSSVLYKIARGQPRTVRISWANSEASWRTSSIRCRYYFCTWSSFTPRSLFKVVSCPDFYHELVSVCENAYNILKVSRLPLAFSKYGQSKKSKDWSSDYDKYDAKLPDMHFEKEPQKTVEPLFSI